MDLFDYPSGVRLPANFYDKEKLIQQKIVLLNSSINDSVAEDIIVRLLYLEAAAPRKDIFFHINSTGGSIPASYAIYDTIKSLNCNVFTVCQGQAGGTALILTASGAKGSRFGWASSKFLFFGVSANSDELSDTTLSARELDRLRELVIITLANETLQPAEIIIAAMENNLTLNSKSAMEFVIIDNIF